MEKLPPYSVLMSVYDGEDPAFFKESVCSMLSQTLPTDDFVLVCDGELTPELDAVIEELSVQNEALHVYRMEERSGTGACANFGIDKCRHEIIVKMDSDDVALPQRCECSVRAMARHPEIDMLGAYIEEFDSDTGEILAVKKTPLKNSEIHKYSKRRNPFNNQTLVYKKALALKAGGYSTIKRCEDYEFVANMLREGAYGVNIGRVLVRYRVTKGNYERRRNWANTKAFFKVRWRLFRSGYSSFIDFAAPCALQLFIFIMPARLTGVIYKKLLRG